MEPRSWRPGKVPGVCAKRGASSEKSERQGSSTNCTPPPPRAPLPSWSPSPASSRPSPALASSQCPTGDGRNKFPWVCLPSPTVGLSRRPCRSSTGGRRWVRSQRVCIWVGSIEVGARDMAGTAYLSVLARDPRVQRAALGGSVGSCLRERGAPGRWRLLFTTQNSPPASAGRGEQSQLLPLPAVPARDLWLRAEGRPWTPRARTAETGRRARLEREMHPGAGRGSSVSLPRRAGSDQRLPAPRQGAHWAPVAPCCPEIWYPLFPCRGNAGGQKMVLGSGWGRGWQSSPDPAQPHISDPKHLGF